MVNELQSSEWAYLLDPCFQLVNTNGKPLTNGHIEVFYHGTRTPYYCASDWNGTLHPFKIKIDSLGSNVVLADPNYSYDVYVYNAYGVLQMSRYNVNPGSGSGGGSSGEGGPAEHWNSDPNGGASSSVTGGTTVYLTLPSSEDQPEFVDHATDTAIFLKEGLYHIDAVVSFKQDEDDLQNIIKDLVVNTGLIGWDAQMTGQKNWTGPESTDDDRHFLELHTVVSVPPEQLQTLYFQISSPVDLDSAAIEKLDIIKLEAGGNGIKYTGGYGIDITGQVISTSGMMPEASAANFVDNSTYQVDIQNIYETIAETSAMIPSGVATEQWVTDYTSAFITEEALDGYATQEWVVDQGYITSADLPQSVPLVAGEGISIIDTSASTIISVDSAYSPGVLEEWVEDYVSDYTSAFITSADIPDVPEDLVTSAELATVSGDIVSQIPSLDGYATQQWVEDQHYITSADIPPIPQDVVTSGELATVSGEIINQIPDVSDMATQTWVNEQGFLTSIPDDLVTSGELATVSGDIMSQIPSQTTVSIDPTLQTGTKIADFNINGTSGELYAPNGGSSYTAGDHIDITNNEISVTGVSGLFAGENVTITTSGGNYYINSTGGGDVPADVVTSGELATVSGQIMNEIPSYTAGDNISIVNDEISVSGTTGLVAGSNITITASGDNYVISSTGGGSGGSEVDIIPSLQTGTKIADYVIDGTSGELYAPAGGGGATYYAGDHIVIDQNNYISTSGLMVENSAFMIDSAGYANRVTEGGAAGTLNVGTVSQDPLQVTGMQDDVEYTLNCSGNTGGIQIYQGEQWNYGYAPTISPTNNEIKFTKSDFVLVASTGKYYLRFGNPWTMMGNNVTLSYGGGGGATRYALETQLPTSGELIPDGGTNGQVLTKSDTGPVWADAPGGGLDQVYHDAGLTGLGTSESPLSITSADIWNSAAGMNEYPISAGPGMSIEDVSGVTVFSTDEITAGTGIKVTTPAAGQIQVAADETVLWENTNQYPAVSAITLTENWNNFKYLRVETTEQFGNGPLTNLFDTQSQSFSGTRAKRFEVGHYACDITNSTLYIRLLMLSFANGEYKNGTIDVVRVSVGNNTSSFTNGTGDTRLVRIVGINRISGGN